MCILLLTQHVKSSVQFSIGFDFSCFFLSPFCFYTDVFETKNKSKRASALLRSAIFCLCTFYLETSLCWCWLVILLLYSIQKKNKQSDIYSHTDTNDTHLHRKKTNNILIRKAVWPPNWTCFRPPFLTCISCDWSYVVFRTKCVY